MNVSLDFPDEIRFEKFRGLRGSFRRVLHNMELMGKYGVNYVCIVTALRSNLRDLDKLAELIFSLKATTLKINPLIAIGRGKEIEAELLEPNDYINLTKRLVKLNEMWPGKVLSAIPLPLLAPFGMQHLKISRAVCSYKNLLSILPNGDISLCGIGITRPETVISSIRKNSITKVWKDGYGLLNEIRNITPDSFEGVCSKCMFKSVCANTCPAYAYEIYGKFTAPNPVCEMLYEVGLFPEKYLLS